ncbi:MAG TPA: tetratricopeptide repeat protein [Cyclobacteriaceae bacterium]
MVRTFYVLLIFAGTISCSKAEVLLPDSVETFLRQAPKDSAYLVKLTDLAFEFLKSNPEIGRSIADKAMAFSKEIGFVHGVIRALNVTGSSYWVTGNYESALNYYHQSAREAEKINDRKGLSDAYNNIGEVYKKLGDYTKAITFLKTSLAWAGPDKTNYDITMFNIGEAFLLVGNYDSASIYFDNSLSRALKDNDVRTIAYAYTGLGRIKYKFQDYYQALAYFTKAEKLWKEQGEIRSLIQTYQDFSATFLALAQGTKAMEYINKAIVLADDISAPDLQIDNYRQQSELYVQLGDAEKALTSIQRHITLKDSIYNEKRRAEISRQQAQFESGAREIENQQLKALHALQDAQIRTQKLMLIALTSALIAAAVMAFVLFRQRKRVAEVNSLLHDKTSEIQKQKEEIECQTSKLQNLNEQLQDLNRSLESKIEERTQRLMWQNQKLAEYAHANAHQLRAPVVSVLGLVNLIQRIDLPEEDKILIDKLQLCGKDLDRITRVISKNLEEDELLK